ncbi:MAG: Pseudouridine synthase [Verrucomicrobiales bacterium]|nr:Pseudouridine synthase [Verrucomicrobiales bacterium]
MRVETLIVEISLPQDRLDTYLRERFPDVSRGAIQRLIEEGHVTVNGKPTKANHSPRAAEQIEIHWPDPKAAEAKPQEMPIDILFEDDELIVLNKAAGVVVHPAAGNEENTMVNALLHHCAGKLSGIGGVARPGIVHRLDKDTSGCLVVAKTDPAHLSLSEQFAGRSVEKTYLAILCGELPQKAGEINAPIARNETQRKKMAVTEKGREARTGFKILERLNSSTYVEAYLFTGRTHQIRVHFHHIGFPIVGDEIYGPRQNKRLIELTRYMASRQMLHAGKLSFTHPTTGEKMSFTSPLPKDFEKTLKALRVK